MFRVFDVLRTDGLDFCKTIRVSRGDGAEHKIVGRIYNGCFGLLFPVGSRDVNGCPKIFRAEALRAMQPTFRDWFLDAELMIKVQRRGLKGAGVPVTYPRRLWGRSHVRVSTVLEFLGNMLRDRVGGHR